MAVLVCQPMASIRQWPAGGCTFRYEMVPNLDCYWVGSFDLNFLGNQVGVSTKPTKAKLFCRGINSNKAPVPWVSFRQVAAAPLAPAEAEPEASGPQFEKPGGKWGGLLVGIDLVKRGLAFCLGGKVAETLPCSGG